MKEDVITLLGDAHIRPTSTRILIYQYIAKQSDTFSLRDIEDALLSIDKSTIFRTLILFEEHHLIHSIEDGSGAMKYCFCRNAADCDSDVYHCHFYCERCKKTYCLDESAVANIALPAGFVMHHINYIVKGVCNKCSQ